MNAQHLSITAHSHRQASMSAERALVAASFNLLVVPTAGSEKSVAKPESDYVGGQSLNTLPR